MGDTFGHRLSGSRNLEAAIGWAVEEMKSDGLENVRAEPVMVPHWVRGRESLEITGADAHRSRCSASATASARRPAASRPSSSSSELRGARGRARARQGKDRPVRRAVHDLRRDRAVPRAGPSRAARSAPSRCSCAPSGRRACARRTPAPSRTPRAAADPGAACRIEDAARLQRMQERGTQCA